jgi:RNA polymerase sigma factor (TIGR02999 family)
MGAELNNLWQAFSRGEASAREHLLALYYEEFRTIARRVLNGDNPYGQGRMHIQPTDLVHEAAIRMIHSEGLAAGDQSHFLALAARVMRLTLIDEVRRHKAAKRGGDVMTLMTDFADAATELDIEDFDGTLDRLALVDEEAARIVELRFYTGLTMPEIATNLDLSERTVHRRWQSARAWLLKEMQAAA